MPPLTPLNATDRHFLGQALALAQVDRTKTAPNPKVGCVIVTPQGDVVGRGVSHPAGGPHAEVVALHQAGDAAAGASVYVTLEPCDHHGRTPPCTRQLQQANVARVIYGLADPNPVAGGGAATLHASQIAVLGPVAPTDLLYDALVADLAGFLTVVTRARPHVTLKLAQQPNGNTKPTNTPYLTGTNARRSVHRMRADADAILVGAGTVLADNPQLTVRDTGQSQSAAMPDLKQPRAVILDRRLQTPLDAAVVRKGTILITRDTHDAASLDAYQQRGVTVSPLPTGANDAEDLTNALYTQVQAGINQVFAEPGLTLAQSLIDAHAVDRLVLHVAGSTATTPFVACVPLEDFRLHTTGRFDQNDTQFTFVSNRKHP